MLQEYNGGVEDNCMCILLVRLTFSALLRSGNDLNVCHYGNQQHKVLFLCKQKTDKAHK